MAVASLVLGIVAVVVNFFGMYWIGLAAAIVGLVLGVKARKTAPSGMATAGFVLSIIGLVVSGITLVACLACVSSVGGALNGLQDAIQ